MEKNSKMGIVVKNPDKKKSKVDPVKKERISAGKLMYLSYPPIPEEKVDATFGEFLEWQGSAEHIKWLREKPERLIAHNLYVLYLQNQTITNLLSRR